MRPPWLPKRVELGRHVPPAVAEYASPSVGALSDDPIIPTTPTNGCPCRIANALMVDMGLPLAARMHLQPTTAVWSAHDQQAHAAEEDARFFPVLRRVADAFTARGSDHGRQLHKAVDRLASDHAEYERDFWSRGAIVPASKFGPHGHLEERIVALYETPIRVEAGLLTAAQADAILARAA